MCRKKPRVFTQVNESQAWIVNSWKMYILNAFGLYFFWVNEWVSLFSLCLLIQESDKAVQNTEIPQLLLYIHRLFLYADHTVLVVRSMRMNEIDLLDAFMIVIFVLYR